MTVQLKKEWASRAEIWLNTNWFDGKKLVMTHYHHIIPVAQYLLSPLRRYRRRVPTSPHLPPPRRRRLKGRKIDQGPHPPLPERGNTPTPGQSGAGKRLWAG